MSENKRPILRLKQFGGQDQPVALSSATIVKGQCATLQPSFNQPPNDGTPLIMYVIYGPESLEHYGRFVVRIWKLEKSAIRAYNPDTDKYSDCGEWKTPKEHPHCLADDLRAARQSIPFGLACFARSPEDNGTIIETWF